MPLYLAIILVRANAYSRASATLHMSGTVYCSTCIHVTFLLSFLIVKLFLYANDSTLLKVIPKKDDRIAAVVELNADLRNVYLWRPSFLSLISIIHFVCPLKRILICTVTVCGFFVHCRSGCIEDFGGFFLLASSLGVV